MIRVEWAEPPGAASDDAPAVRPKLTKEERAFCDKWDVTPRSLRAMYRALDSGCDDPKYHPFVVASVLFAIIYAGYLAYGWIFGS